MFSSLSGRVFLSCFARLTMLAVDTHACGCRQHDVATPMSHRHAGSSYSIAFSVTSDTDKMSPLDSTALLFPQR